MMLKNLMALSSCFLFLLSCGRNKNETSEVILDKDWKFKKGDSTVYRNMEYDDSKWDTISPGRSWESQGFTGHDGYAWYRVTMTLPSSLKANNDLRALIFSLGTIDDNDQVYLNGKLIGINGRSMPDDEFKEIDPMDGKGSFYTTNRLYQIPIDDKVILWDKPNVLAIRVLDKLDDGGMRLGTPLVYASPDLPEQYRTIKLDADWKFKKSSPSEKVTELKNSNGWSKILPDLEWEQQGYSDYDGFAWYSIKFTPTSSMVGTNFSRYKMRLYLGTIDDYDQVFLNGQLIGQNGITVLRETKSDTAFITGSSYYDKERNYMLDLKDKRIRWDQENTLTIRVYDAMGGGGMTHGKPRLSIIPKQSFQVDKSKFYTFSLNSLVDTLLVFRNLDSYRTSEGSIRLKVQSKQNKKVLYQKDYPYAVKQNDSVRVPISLPSTLDVTDVVVSVLDPKGNLLTKETFTLPFILRR